MDTDKAYILGLIIGGGIWGNAEDVFKIKLPYKQWGSYKSSPERAGQISQDIMRLISPLFRAIYGISVSYDTSISGIWNLLCEGDLSELKKELNSYGIICEGEIRKNADISKIVKDLVDDNLKRRFIAGLADTIGSTTKSHRRFNDDKQIISFEISGFDFNFVCSLCKLLHSIKCYPDQILWNHPNFHSGSNPYYRQWKKGFKLRVFLDQYDKFGAFAFTSKAISAKENKKLQIQENQGVPCEEREIGTPSFTCVHCDENSDILPKEIRGGHYLHNRHVCAVLKCEHAPLSEVKKLIDNAQYYINPFPILVKGTAEEITVILETEKIYKNRKYKTIYMRIRDVLAYEDGNEKLLFSNGEAGYPVNTVLSAVTYLVAAEMNKLNGSRPRGNRMTILTEYLTINPDAKIKIEIPEIFTPIIISKGKYSTIVGPANPNVYKKLINISAENEFKLEIADISEDDLR